VAKLVKFQDVPEDVTGTIIGHRLSLLTGAAVAAIFAGRLIDAIRFLQLQLELEGLSENGNS
jgi:hypothetical protein